MGLFEGNEDSHGGFDVKGIASALQCLRNRFLADKGNTTRNNQLDEAGMLLRG